MFFVKRYLFGFIITCITSISLFFSSIYFFEGLIPTITGILAFIAIIGYFPYNIKQDYNTIKRCVINLNNVRKGEMTKTDFSLDFATKVCDETGFPEFVVHKVIKKIAIK